ncbi:hypothetical protein [Chitinimonas naiadis]
MQNLAGKQQDGYSASARYLEDISHGWLNEVWAWSNGSALAEYEGSRMVVGHGGSASWPVMQQPADQSFDAAGQDESARGGDASGQP